MPMSHVLDSRNSENEPRESVITSGMKMLLLPKLGSYKREIISKSWDFERGSLLTPLLLRLDWAEQPGWQGPVLSTRKALIQKQEALGEQRQQYAKKKKNPLENNKTTQKPVKKERKKVSGGWLPAAL